jgi:hypothetical protein
MVNAIRTLAITAMTVSLVAGAALAQSSDSEVLVIRKERPEQNVSQSAPFEPVTAAPRLIPGYRVAWKDGRLNPFRARSSRLGTQRVLILTNSEPKRLIDAKTGEDVTAQYQLVVAPFGPPSQRTEVLTGTRGFSAPSARRYRR